MKFPPKKLSLARRTIWAFLFVAILGSAAHIAYDDYGTSPAKPTRQNIEAPAAADKEAEINQFKDTSEVPVRIRISRIGVDAAIEPVGLTADGLMAAPDTDELVGWYDKSARAGEDEYAMLLDGHYGSDTKPAVFRRLVELEVGDSIEITGDGGSILKYEVAESYQRYAEDVDMKKALYPYRDEVQSLTIITCEGLYDPVNVAYDKRTILYAIRVA